jgi:hypothetical protein
MKILRMAHLHMSLILEWTSAFFKLKKKFYSYKRDKLNAKSGMQMNLNDKIEKPQTSIRVL